MKIFESVNDDKSIIYYGGSFNPPHIAHIMMVSVLRAYFPKARIWIAPTYQHAFQKSLMPFDLRVEMLQKTVGDVENVEISTIERDLHDSTSYTIDVVRSIHAQNPEAKIWIVVGSDIVPTLPQWREYDEIQKLAQFLIFPRAGYDNAMALKIPMLPEVSSSEIREKIKAGESVCGLVPAAVYELLVSSDVI